MRSIKHIFLLMITIATLNSCYRDELCYLHPNNAIIELKIDWSRSKLSPNSATALIYKDNVLYSTEIFSAYPPVRKLVDLPIGNYSFVVFNDMDDDYAKSLAFSGREGFQTFQVESIDDVDANRYARALTRALKTSVDTMAVDRRSNFEVTQDMINNSHKHPTSQEEVENYQEIAASITFIPKRVFTVTDITVRVKYGNGYYFTPRNPPVLDGTSGVYSPGKNFYNPSSVPYGVSFTQLPQNVSDKIVVYKASLQVVGVAEYLNPMSPSADFHYNLSLPFTYSAGIIYKEIDLKREATRFEFIPEDPTQGRCYDNLIIEIDLELPELVIIGGMDVNVEDWTEVDIPLDAPQRLNFIANNGTKESFWWSNLPGVKVNLPASPFTPVEKLVFKEWNTLPDGSGTTYIPGDEYTMTRGGMIFYAIWIQKK